MLGESSFAQRIILYSEKDHHLLSIYIFQIRALRWPTDINKIMPVAGFLDHPIKGVARNVGDQMSSLLMRTDMIIIVP
jgi:hypothetical protein